MAELIEQIDSSYDNGERTWDWAHLHVNDWTALKTAIAALERTPSSTAPITPTVQQAIESAVSMLAGFYGTGEHSLDHKIYREQLEKVARIASTPSAIERITEGPFAGLPKPHKVPEGYVLVDKESFEIILGVLTEEQTREICVKEGERLLRADGGNKTNV